MEDITDADYAHAKRVCKDSEIENLGEDHDRLLLAGVFENFRNMCLEMSFSSWTSMASSFKKD